MPRAEEVAEIEVNGQRLSDWEIVRVEHRADEGFHTFDFSVSEKPDLPPIWTKLQIKPGDAVTIYLAGKVAMKGFVTHREVAYDARSHGVRLMGRSWTWDVARASIKTEDGNFDKMGFSAVAQKLLSPFGVTLETVGAVDETPFKRLQVMPGERVYMFLARLAAHRDMLLGAADGNTNALRVVGKHGASVTDQLVEGQNIKRANCMISNEHIFDKYFADGQQAGDDKEWHDDVAKQRSELGGSYQRYAPKIAPTELAGQLYDVQKRVQFEGRWSEGTLISAEIVVHGWLNSKGDDLWRILTYPMVKSPMLMIDQPLGIRRATFTQSRAAGTLTELELVVPWFLNAGNVFWAGKDLLPKDPVATGGSGAP